jgi:hypothetical protein
MIALCFACIRLEPDLKASHLMSRSMTCRSGLIRTAAVAWLGIVVVLSGSATAQPVFTDVTGAAGLTYLQHTAQTPPNCIFINPPNCETDRLTGGAAVGDFDDDDLPDLYVTRLDAPDILFRNKGDGTFEDVTASAGLSAYDLNSNGAAFGDIDRDDDLDLFVTVVGEKNDPINSRHYLFVNQGDGTFAEEAIARGAAVDSGLLHRGFSVTFGDYDLDGWIDLHVNEWFPYSGTASSHLLQNLGPDSPGVFADTTVSAGVSLSSTSAFASSFADLDDDGWPDLVVAADFGTSKLFWNNGNGTFTDGTLAAGVGTDENGMGSAIGDHDGDGDLDWFVTAIFDADETCETQLCNWGYSGNRLYRNDGNRDFGDATDAADVREGFWDWGAVFFDYDNDGDLDLVMTNGVDFPGLAADLAFNTDPMRFWENDGTGAYTEKSVLVGLTDTRQGKGLLVFDYDGDGDLDLFVANNAAGPVLYRNDGGNAADWLRVETIGTASNVEGLGARVTIQAVESGPTQIREIGVASHYLGQSERIAHFGLGTGTGPVHSVTIAWPSGQFQQFSDVARNTTLVANESAIVQTPALDRIGHTMLIGLLALGIVLTARPRLNGPDSR